MDRSLHVESYRHARHNRRSRRRRPLWSRSAAAIVPETLTRALDQLTAEYEKAIADPTFHAELDDLYRHYVGRPSPLYLAERLRANSAAAGKSTSSAKTSTTPAPTRSTTRSARPC